MDLKVFNVERLLKPYREGGSIESPSKRSLETIVGKLIVSNRMKPEIVGAVVIQTLWDMAQHGLEFKGDGTHGSRGKELFGYIRDKCIELTKQDAVDIVIKSVSDKISCGVLDCPKRSINIGKKTRWQRVVRFMLKPRGLWRI